jgi:hypothetical protein
MALQILQLLPDFNDSWALVSPSRRFCMLVLWLLQMLADLVLPALKLCVCGRSSKSESVLGTIDQ